MRILYITQFYPPEIGAAANRAYETAKILASEGYDVTILTAIPNYLMDSKQSNSHMKRQSNYEDCEGVHVIRTRLYINRNLYSLAGRFLTFFTFMMSSLWRGLYSNGYDVILTTSPPLSLGFTAYVLSRMKGVPYIFEIRDLYPESASQLGVIKNRFVIRVMKCFASFLYRNAYHLIAVTEGIRKHLEVENSRRKISVITTGVDLSLFKPMVPELEIVDQFHLGNKCNVLFIGIFGRMHALTVILDAAMLLRNESSIQFTFIGDGVQKEFLVREVQRRNIKNVQLFPPQMRKMVPKIINACNICLDSRIKIELSQGTIPVKVVEYMACGKPIVMGISGETAKIINDAKSGQAVEPENAEAMADAILKISRDIRLQEQLGRNGRTFALRHFDREIKVRTLIKILDYLS